MKAIIRVPTVQYGYIEVEADVESQMDAIEMHNDMVKLYKGTQVSAESTTDAW